MAARNAMLETLDRQPEHQENKKKRFGPEQSTHRTTGRQFYYWARDPVTSHSSICCSIACLIQQPVLRRMAHVLTIAQPSFDPLNAEGRQPLWHVRITAEPSAAPRHQEIGKRLRCEKENEDDGVRCLSPRAYAGDLGLRGKGISCPCECFSATFLGTVL